MSLRSPDPRPLRYPLAAAALPGVIGLCALAVGGASSAPSLAADTALADLAAEHCLANPAHGAENPRYRRSLVEYRLPDVRLVSMEGLPTGAGAALAADRPVMLNFIFTSCSTICPVLSATFAQVQDLLGADAERIRFVSISIDPEHDTPEVLLRYARRYGANGNWQFLTGSRDDVVALQRAFDAYRGNKMSHRPLTFLRLRAGAPWLRIEGFPKAEDLVREYRGLTATGAAAQTAG